MFFFLHYITKHRHSVSDTIQENIKTNILGLTTKTIEIVTTTTTIEKLTISPKPSNSIPDPGEILSIFATFSPPP